VDVLFLDQFSELGGAQKCLLDLLPEIHARGWRASAALPGNGPLVKLLQAEGVHVHSIPSGPYRSGSKSIADIAQFMHDVRQQVNILRPLKFDLLYVNGPRMLAGAAKAYGNRAAVLFHAHSRIPAGVQNWVANRSLRQLNATVAACAKAIAPGVSSHVIANGTPDMGFKERNFNQWRIGMIGTIRPEKGQLEFLRAAATLATKFENVRFTICGAPADPGGDYDRAVQKYCDALPVDLLGWRTDVASVLSGLDLLVITSKSEGMPRVMLEAFSAGVPVVAFPVGGIPEVVRDGETGFLVHRKTPEALAACLGGIIRRGGEPIRNIAANARREWEKKYTVDIYRKNITALMESLVSGRPPAREIEPQRSHR